MIQETPPGAYFKGAGAQDTGVHYIYQSESV